MIEAQEKGSLGDRPRFVQGLPVLFIKPSLE